MSTARELLSRLDSLEVKLWNEQGRLRFSAPIGVVTEELKAELRERKAELLALLDGQIESIPRLPDKPAFPLSHAQRRMWVLSQLDDGFAAYNIPLHQLLEGPLDADALQHSLARCVRRHESLRTSIIVFNDEPQQVIHDQVDTRLHFIDLSERDQPLEAAKQLALDDARQPFDLEHGPLFRAALLRLDDQRHVLLFTIHHIVCDGVSIAILGKELTGLYKAFCRTELEPFPPLRIQYRDYADWQNQLIRSGALAIDRDWWLQTFRDLPAILELPTDFPRPPLQTFEGRELSFHLTPDLLKALHQLGRQHNASLYMTLLTTLYVLLYKYTGQTDLVVGSPVAGRSHPDLENQIGLYLNAIALRNQIDGEASFVDFLKQVRHTTVAAFDHQAYPFDELVSELNLARDLSRNPLFDVTIILQNQDDSGLTFDDVTARSFIAHPGTSKTDLTFNFHESPGGLSLAIEYNSNLFVDDRMARMGRHFCQLVNDIVAEPGQSIGRLNMLAFDETYELLERFNATSRSYPSDQTVVSLFEQQVRSKPDKIAVQCEEVQITYRELAQRVDQLACHLQSLGVGRNSLVGVCLDRSIQMVAAVLAVLKAGGAYVPLDPSFPHERLALMLSDAGVPVLLTQSILLNRLPQSAAQVICLDAGGALDSQVAPVVPCVPDSPSSSATPTDLAYVIYTSGSTGRPKGVCISQFALVNFLCSMAREPGVTADDVVLAVTTLSFDIAGLEIFLPLIQGAKLVLATRETATDGMRLLELLNQCDATVMQATPATWRMLLAAGWRASPQLKAFCGGEALPTGLADQLLQRCDSVWNMYGPTETTIWSTLHELSGGGGDPQDAIVPIGRPIANTQIYILDRHLQPVPIGVPGDLYIGGNGLATEYLNQPELTREKFLPHPFRTDSQFHVYKTGDKARFQSNGVIHFIGRADHQIKLRGFRIELGEIEATLAAHPAVEQAIADLRADGASDQRLVAWYVVAAAQNVTPSELRDYLKAKLPDYMIPSLLVGVREFPLTPNGKVDRRALALPQQLEDSQSKFTPPKGHMEKAIAEIWKEVLELPRIGAHDNFFELGGHSLKATQVISRMHRELTIVISLRELFSHPTVEGMARTVAGKQSRPFVSIPQTAAAEHYELSHGQRRLWVLSQMEDGLIAYNLPAALRLEGKVDAVALQKSIDALVQRHESLRTSFVVIDGQPRARVSPSIELPIHLVDLSGQLDPEKQARELAMDEARRPFDLKTPGLLRSSLIKLSDDQWVLLFNIHHIIADQWSLEVVVREFTEHYSSRRELAPLRIQYRDYAHWQNRYLDSDDARVHRDYWLSKLGGEIPVLNLPTDFIRPPIKTFHGKTHSFRFDRNQTEALQELSQQRGASLFMTLVAAVKTLLYRYTGESDMLIGFPSAGRNHADLESQIGFYVNTLPLRSELRDDMSFNALLDRVKATCTEAYEHQIYPFDKLVDELELARDVSRNPLFDVAVVMHHHEPGAMSLSGLTVSSFVDDYNGSKYDIHFAFDVHDEILELAIVYNTDLFRPERIERMSQHFQQVVASVLDDASQTVGCLNILTKSERAQLLNFNPGRHSFPCHATLVQWFEAQVAQRPDAVAVIFPELAANPPSTLPAVEPLPLRQSVTYAELNARANRLAHHLREMGVQPNAVVGLYFEPSLETVVSILAVLKAGGAYLPLDVAHPVQRLRIVLEDADVRVLVTRQPLADQLADSRWRIVDLGSDQAQILSHSPMNPAQHAKQHDLAYVIYTSGSTGRPKGVPVSHHSVTRLFAATDSWFRFNHEDVWTLFHSYAFDFSVWEIWGALLYGGRLVVVPHWITRTPEAFLDLVVDEGVTVLNQTPSAFGQLIRVDSQQDSWRELALRLVIFGGEALETPSLRPWFERHGDQRPQLINMYGITETTVFVTYCPVRVEDTVRPTSRIGMAIPDLRVYLLDRQLNPVPIGVPGEIFVGGPGVACGYLNRPELTSEKFVTDPFCAGAERLYRSGDLGRYCEDGDIEYLGRLDDQIQIRGFRVETGEIAAVLADHPGVAEAIVVAQGTGANVRLVAYFVPSRTVPDTLQLRRFLSERLPGYMVPAIFVKLDQLPLTANNKVDRKALPAAEVPLPSDRTNFAAPRDELEHVVAGVFADILRVEQVGAHDNFFDLGGDSLLATQVVARLRDTFRADISIVQLFTAQDVASLAEVVRDKTPGKQGDRIARAVRRLQAMTDEEKQKLASQG